MRVLSSFVLLGMALLLATPAHAVIPVFDMGLLTNTVSQDHNVKNEDARAARTSPERLVAPDLSVGTARAPATALRFQTSRKRTQANLASFVAKTRAVDPAGAAGLEQTFARQDMMAIIGQAIEPYGFVTNDVADAYATWWMTAWIAAFDPPLEPSRATAQAVKRQASDALRATPEFAGLSDAQKQELSEAYLIQAAMISAAVDQAGGDPARLAQVAASVRKGARASGMDLSVMVLSDSGFQPR